MNRDGVARHAFAGLARRMKEKEIAGLRESASELLKLRGEKAVTNEIASALKKRMGTVTVVAEYRRKGSQLGMVEEVLPPNIMSREFRTGGATAVAVLLEKATGGCSVEDVASFVAEQAMAARDYPGPCPVIWHDLVIDEVQLAQASSTGAKGVVLSMGVLGSDFPEMVGAAAEYGLEVVVEVKSKAELDALKASPIAAAVTMVAVSGMAVDDQLAMAAGIPDSMVKIALLPVYDDKALIEVRRSASPGRARVARAQVTRNCAQRPPTSTLHHFLQAEDAWRLRDAGFNSIWASEVLVKFGLADGEGPMSIIRAIKVTEPYTLPLAAIVHTLLSASYVVTIMRRGALREERKKCTKPRRCQ